MRRGYRSQTLKVVTQSFDGLFLNLHNQYPSTLMNWRFVYQTFYNTTFCSSSHSNSSFLNKAELILDRGAGLNKKDYLLVPQSNFFSKFLSLLEAYFPIFSFSIRKVNKDLRKNSRGKSGKYTVMWKYIPLYKRLYTTMRWLLKDLKFQKFRTIELRLQSILELLFLNPSLLFLHRVRNFTHKHVFKHFKKTLLRSLKSV
jgi:hypothetical protein